MSGFGVSISTAICIILLIIVSIGIISTTVKTFQDLNEAFEANIHTQQDVLRTEFKFLGKITSINKRIISFYVKNTGSKSFSPEELTFFDLMLNYQINSTNNRLAWIPFSETDIIDEHWNYTFEGNYWNNPSSWDPAENISITIQINVLLASNSSNFLQFSSSNGVSVSTYFEVM